MTADELELLKRIAGWLGPAGMVGALWLAWRAWRLVDARVADGVAAAIAKHTDSCNGAWRAEESELREEMRSLLARLADVTRQLETLWRRLDEQRDAFSEHQVYAARTYVKQEDMARLYRDAEVIREQVARLAERRR